MVRPRVQDLRNQIFDSKQEHFQTDFIHIILKSAFNIAKDIVMAISNTEHGTFDNIFEDLNTVLHIVIE